MPPQPLRVAANAAIAVVVAGAVADAVNVALKVARKAVVTAVKAAADAVVEANALTMRQPPTPALRVKYARPAARDPRVAASGRNAVIRAPRPVPNHQPRDVTALAEAVAAVVESARSATTARHRSATRWRPMSCH